MFNKFNFESLWMLLAGVVLFVLAALLGKAVRAYQDRQEIVADDVVKIVLGATLSLFGLLLGFLLSFAIAGYNTRMQAEENEAFAIGHAMQRAALLQAHEQSAAEGMLKDYLQERILFFGTADPQERQQARRLSSQLQTRMWLLLSKQARANPSALHTSLLDACDALYLAQQKTLSSWRAQIPAPAWALAIIFALCSNFLIGYTVHGVRGNYALVTVLPFLIALSLYVIAQIDVPGEGLIHVLPDNMRALHEMISDPQRSL
ncbi:hypothetical protein [Castellaniella sp.]|uniref:bestrophin-like domain n=1 Tax=Castellaniella sp. TaxID=1955812 RepID=UPI0035630FAD